MIYRDFGKTGLKISPLGFGAMRLPMVQLGEVGYIDFEKAIPVIHAAFEKGVNYIDSGLGYGNAESEIVVGRALKGWRDKVTLSTKATRTRMSRPGDLRRQLEHQLAKLDVDYLDFYCFHGIGWDNWHETDKATGWIADMEKAKAEGLVRRIAFSFHDEPENMIKLIDTGMFEAVTCQYNYLDQRNADSIAYAHEKGLAVVVMGPVGGGRLAELPGFVKKDTGLSESKAATLALRFVLANPNVNVALSGMGSLEMVEENVAAAEAGPLSAAERDHLSEMSKRLKKMADLYCTACKYCMPCPHGVQIPDRFGAMNFLKVYGMEDHARRVYANIRKKEETLEGKGVCIECGACVEKCPQHIPIIEQLKEAEAALGVKKE
jgi:hypothetical protein